MPPKCSSRHACLNDEGSAATPARPAHAYTLSHPCFCPPHNMNSCLNAHRSQRLKVLSIQLPLETNQRRIALDDNESASFYITSRASKFGSLSGTVSPINARLHDLQPHFSVLDDCTRSPANEGRSAQADAEAQLLLITSKSTVVQFLRFILWAFYIHNNHKLLEIESLG